MPSQSEQIDSQRPRLLRIYNLYRVILGFGLTLLTSSVLRDGLLDLSDPPLYAKTSWVYLFINVLVALLLHLSRLAISCCMAVSACYCPPWPASV